MGAFFCTTVLFRALNNYRKDFWAYFCLLYRKLHFSFGIYLSASINPASMGIVNETIADS